MSDAIPVLSAPSDVYAADVVSAENARWDEVQRVFGALYGAPVQFVARAPGRVNLIGECVVADLARRLCRIQVCARLTVCSLPRFTRMCSWLCA